jgi:hypothetical protein
MEYLLRNNRGLILNVYSFKFNLQFFFNNNQDIIDELMKFNLQLYI